MPVKHSRAKKTQVKECGIEDGYVMIHASGFKEPEDDSVIVVAPSARS